MTGKTLRLPQISDPVLEPHGLAQKLKDAFIRWAGRGLLGANMPETWLGVQAAALEYFSPSLYTVEYEELRAGQTATGTEDRWFSVVEIFDSRFDDPPARARARVCRLLSDVRYRNIALNGWAHVAVLPVAEGQ